MNHHNNNLLEFDEDDQSEEALSFCDLARNSFALDHEEFYKRPSFEKDSFFEFISEDFSASTAKNDNIIFCGKLIPYKEAKNMEEEEARSNTKREEKTCKKSRGFALKSLSFSKSRTSRSSSSSSSSSSSLLSSSFRRQYGPTRPIKSRWYLLAFGVGRISMEMDVNSMKMRQSKRRSISTATSSKMLQPSSAVEMSGKTHKGLWRLVGFLGCTSQYLATGVKSATIGGAPCAD